MEIEGEYDRGGEKYDEPDEVFDGQTDHDALTPDETSIDDFDDSPGEPETVLDLSPEERTGLASALERFAADGVRVRYDITYGDQDGVQGSETNYSLKNRVPRHLLDAEGVEYDVSVSADTASPSQPYSVTMVASRTMPQAEIELATDGSDGVRCRGETQEAHIITFEYPASGTDTAPNLGMTAEGRIRVTLSAEEYAKVSGKEIPYRELFEQPPLDLETTRAIMRALHQAIAPRFEVSVAEDMAATLELFAVGGEPYIHDDGAPGYQRRLSEDEAAEAGLHFDEIQVWTNRAHGASQYGVGFTATREVAIQLRPEDPSTLQTSLERFGLYINFLPDSEGRTRAVVTEGTRAALIMPDGMLGPEYPIGNLSTDEVRQIISALRQYGTNPR